MEQQAWIAWWNCFLQDWHGAAFVIPGDAPGIHVHSNTAGSFGCGTVTSSDRWLQVQWPDSWSEVSIAAKEMAPIVMAAVTWGRTWHCCNIFFHCDNTAVVVVIQRKSMKDALLLHLLHCLYFYAAFFKFLYSAITSLGCPMSLQMHYQGQYAIVSFSFPTGCSFYSVSGGNAAAVAPAARLVISGLDKAVQGYLMTSLSPSTLCSYQTAALHFAIILALHPHFLLPSWLLAQFAAFLAERNLSYGSIRVCASGIHFSQITLGFSDPALSSLLWLEYVLRGICRASPGHLRLQRLPVTPRILTLVFDMVTTTNITGCSDVVGGLL